MLFVMKAEDAWFPRNARPNTFFPSLTVADNVPGNQKKILNIENRVLEMLLPHSEGDKTIYIDASPGCVFVINLFKKHKRMQNRFVITKTRLYKFDPLESIFYIVKLGFTGVYFIFLILLKNIDCGFSLEPPRRDGSNEYQQSMFSAEI